jgi:hypothetical protein
MMSKVQMAPLQMASSRDEVAVEERYVHPLLHPWVGEQVEREPFGHQVGRVAQDPPDEDTTDWIRKKTMMTTPKSETPMANSKAGGRTKVGWGTLRGPLIRAGRLFHR